MLVNGLQFNFSMGSVKNSQFLSFIESVLYDIAEQEGIKNVSLNFGDSGGKGNGYVGVVDLVELKGSNKTLHLMVKTASSDASFRDNLPLRESFLVEIDFYDKVVPCFMDLQKNTDQIFDAFPKCYYTCKEEFQELLVLENLKVDKYDIADRFEPLDERHVELVMREYGRLHAFSLALKDQQPDKYKELAQVLGQTIKKWLIKAKMINTNTELCRRIAKKIDDNMHLEQIKKTFDKMRSLYLNYDHARDPLAVILHSDCWITNYMFKYENVNDEVQPTHVKLIDFQIARSGSIIYDLSHFLCTCAQKPIWENLDYYLTLYHESLCDFLKKLGSDPKKIIPYNVLKKEFKKKCKYGLMIAPQYLKASVLETSEAPELKEINEEDEFLFAFLSDSKNENVYQERYRFLLDYYYHNDLY